MKKKFLVLVVSVGLAFSILTTEPGCGNSYSSNGQRIYFSATSASGQPISYIGPPGMMMRGSLSCVNCHGSRGQGGTFGQMMQRYDVPNITWPELSADLPPYTEDSLKRAIIQGVDPSGSQLKYPMPRWQMSESDLGDLITFIKTLK